MPAPKRRGVAIPPQPTTGIVPPGASVPRVVGRRAPATPATTDEPLLKDPFRLAMLALVVETISKLASFIGPLTALRPALLLFVFCLLFALASPSRALSAGLFRFTAPKLILLQAAIACASVLFGISLGHAAIFVINVYWKTIAFALLLMASLRGISDLKRVVWATALGGFLLAFVAIFIVHISKDQGAEQYDANDVGLIMVTTLPLALLLMQTSGKAGKAVAIFGLALIAETIVKTSSRGAFVGAASVGVALLLFLPGISVVKRTLAVVGIVGVMAWFAPSGYWESMETVITNPKADYNWDAPQGRRQIAKRGISYMVQYPLFGIGIDNFAMAEGTISEYAKSVAGTDIGVKWSAPHNSWVEAGAETGVPGLLTWAALVVGSSVGLLRIRRRMPSSWAKTGTADERFLYLATLYVPIAFLGFVVCGTFVSFAWSDQSYILPAIALGIFKSFEDKTRGAATHPVAASRAGRRGARVLRPNTA